MVYSLDSDQTPYVAPVNNRFTRDWVAFHMMSTICRLTDQRNASYNFLKNGGMAFAQNLKELRASDLALAARVVEPMWGDSLEAMQAASANVLGTDGHRRHCRHEGWADIKMFSPPLIFLTPNIADTQHPLLLVIQGETVDLGAVAADMPEDLQDMRRVLDPALWLDSEEHLPHVGFTDSLGYMAWYEWNGKAYEVRSDAPSTSVSWLNRRDWAPDFRSAWLTAHQQFMEKEGEPVTSDAQDEDAPMPPAEDGQQDAHMANAEETDDSTAELTRAIRCGISEAFCDGINSGFYINSYTTKPGPGLAGMLEELQKGLQKVVYGFGTFSFPEKMFCPFLVLCCCCCCWCCCCCL